MEKLLGSKRFSQLVKLAAALVILVSIAILIFGLWSGQSRALKDINKKLGSMAEYGAIATGALWAVRHSWLFLKKNKINAASYIREVFLLLKKYHTIIGYTVFALGTSHGIYFLLKGSRKIILVYSGIGALVGLLLVVVGGMMLQKFGVGKKHIQYRKIHQGIAILFGLSLLIHLLV